MLHLLEKQSIIIEHNNRDKIFPHKDKDEASKHMQRWSLWHLFYFIIMILMGLRLVLNLLYLLTAVISFSEIQMAIPIPL